MLFCSRGWSDVDASRAVLGEIDHRQHGAGSRRERVAAARDDTEFPRDVGLAESAVGDAIAGDLAKAQRGQHADSDSRSHHATLLEQITEPRVLALFAHRGASRVRRYPMPGLAGMNLVIDEVLQGGINGALNLDGHGKTLSFLLLGLTVTLPRPLLPERLLER